MDADRVGQRHPIEFPTLVLDGPPIKLDDECLRVKVNAADIPDITVEHVFVVVVLGLHHLVPDAKTFAKALSADDELRSEVAAYEEVVAGLAEAVPEQAPPEGLRDRILREARSEGFLVAKSPDGVRIPL